MISSIVTSYIDLIADRKRKEKDTLSFPSLFYDKIPYDGYRFVRNNNSYFKHLYQTRLKKPLIKNYYYYFEMYYQLKSLSGEADKVPTGMIGVSFSSKDYTDLKLRKLLIKNKIKIKPEIFISEFDSSSLHHWVKFYGVFKAKGNSKEFAKRIISCSLIFRTVMK